VDRELSDLAERFATRLRAFLSRTGARDDLDDLVQAVWLLACERWSAGDRPGEGDEHDWLIRLARRVWNDRIRSWEIHRIVLPTISLETPALTTSDESPTIADIIADPTTPDQIVTSRETVHELVRALQSVGPAPARIEDRPVWQQRVAAALVDDPAVPVEIVAGVCGVCAGPLHVDRSGQPLPHHCPGPWRVIEPADDLPLYREVTGRWRSDRTCLLCDRPVLRGRVYCTVHKRWAMVRAGARRYRDQTRTIVGGRRHLCAWCGKAWARANRPYCSIRCSGEAARARRLQEA
jgi:DNA-directed RNA polymerase specialized sigma24 family protein